MAKWQDYKELLAMAEQAADGADADCSQVELKVIELIHPEATPMIDSGVDEASVGHYAVRAVLGDIMVRMQLGERDAMDDMDRVFGPIVRGQAHGSFEGGRRSYNGETVSDLVQTTYRRLLVYAESGRLTIDSSRDSLQALRRVILKRAASQKKRRAESDVLARTHMEVRRVREGAALEVIEYEDFVDHALIRGQKELDELGFRVLCARLEDPGCTLRKVSDSLGQDYAEVKNAWARRVKPFLRTLRSDHVW